MKILKKIGSITLDVLIVIVFIISILVVIASVTAKRDNGQANVFGYTVNSVQTDSMEPKINEGDLIISKVITDANREKMIPSLQKDKIVSFYDNIREGKKILITHRIVEVQDNKSIPTYVTWGDNRVSAPAPDVPITINEIQSVYLFRIPLLGHFIDFLKTPLGFIICLVLPLLSFIGWQAYKLIVLFFKSKQAELAEEAESIKKSKGEISEEEKNAIIAEYLAKQQEQAKQDEAPKQETKNNGAKANTSKKNNKKKK